MAAQFVDESKTMIRLSDFTLERQQMLPPIEGYKNEPIVSLEQAIEPLVSLIPDVETIVAILKQKCQQPENNLSPDESASIMLYTFDVSFYSTLNATLRDENRQKLKPWFLYLRLIIFALSKLPSISLQTIYRGVKMDMRQEFPERKVFVWWGFSSCTSSIQTIEQYLGKNGPRTMFIIDCDSAKDISRHSFYRIKNEILLHPPRQFQVISSCNSDNELYIIRLKEVQAIHISQIFPSKSFYQNQQLYDLLDGCEYHSQISLYKKNLNDRDIIIVVNEGINKKRCLELWLEQNEITSVGALIIASALNNNTALKWLSLSSNRICDIGVEALAKTLAFNNSTLNTLALHSTGITDKGVEYLAEMLKTNQTLTELELSENEIGDRGVQLLTNVLAYHNNTFKWLSLSKNKLVSDSSTDCLVQMLKCNGKLQELYIDNCSFTDRGKQRLLQSVESKYSFCLKV